MRELEVIENVLQTATRRLEKEVEEVREVVTHPQKNIAPITMTCRSVQRQFKKATDVEVVIEVPTIKTIAPFSPTVSRKICVTGCPV